MPNYHKMNTNGMTNPMTESNMSSLNQNMLHSIEENDDSQPRRDGDSESPILEGRRNQDTQA